MYNIFNNKGMVNKWKIEWLQDCFIHQSYSAMFSSYCQKYLLSTSTTIVNSLDRLQDESSESLKGCTDIIGWNDRDLQGFVIFVKHLDYLNNTYNYTTVNDGCFIKTTKYDGAKVYACKYKGSVKTGDIWKNNTLYAVKYCKDFEQYI